MHSSTSLQDHREVFRLEPRDVKVVEAEDLSLRAVLAMAARREERDSLLLSCVCDDQASG